MCRRGVRRIEERKRPFESSQERFDDLRRFRPTVVQPPVPGPRLGHQHLSRGRLLGNDAEAVQSCG